MRNWFYDNQIEANKDDPDFLDVDRIYCFNEDDFTAEDRQKLGQFLEELPTGLNISMEYPWGMQVYGTVKQSEWQAWHAIFQEDAQHLPHYEVETDDEAFQPENKDRPKVWRGIIREAD